jgi:hypothetical protein
MVVWLEVARREKGFKGLFLLFGVWSISLADYKSGFLSF